jgi:hypothetical protein
MRRLISVHTAARSVIIILSLIVIFHLLVLAGIIPYKIVWGGRLESTTDMIRFEFVSIGINLLMLAIVANKSGYLNWGKSKQWVRIGLWIMVVLFSVNTLGNLVAINIWEKIIFTPLTLLLAFFSFRLAID